MVFFLLCSTLRQNHSGPQRKLSCNVIEFYLPFLLFYHWGLYNVAHHTHYSICTCPLFKYSSAMISNPLFETCVGIHNSPNFPIYRRNETEFSNWLPCSAVRADHENTRFELHSIWNTRQLPVKKVTPGLIGKNVNKCEGLRAVLLALLCVTVDLNFAVRWSAVTSSSGALNFWAKIV